MPGPGLTNLWPEEPGLLSKQVMTYDPWGWGACETPGRGDRGRARVLEAARRDLGPDTQGAPSAQTRGPAPRLGPSSPGPRGDKPPDTVPAPDCQLTFQVPADPAAPALAQARCPGRAGGSARGAGTDPAPHGSKEPCRGHGPPAQGRDL